MKIPKSADELPTTSVAEFRQAGWRFYHHYERGSVSMGIYFTWGLLGGAVALLAFGLGGLTVSAQSWWIVLAGVLATALVVRRIVRVFREAAENRARVVAMSREIDSRAARGEIPMTPPGWDGPIRVALDE